MNKCFFLLLFWKARKKKGVPSPVHWVLSFCTEFSHPLSTHHAATTWNHADGKLFPVRPHQPAIFKKQQLPEIPAHIGTNSCPQQLTMIPSYGTSCPASLLEHKLLGSSKSPSRHILQEAPFERERNTEYSDCLSFWPYNLIFLHHWEQRFIYLFIFNSVTAFKKCFSFTNGGKQCFFSMKEDCFILRVQVTEIK